MTPGKIDAQGLAVIAGERRQRAPLPEREPVPYRDYATLKAASARSSEVIPQLTKRLEFYGEPDCTVIRAAEAHRRYLRSLVAAL